MGHTKPAVGYIGWSAQQHFPEGQGNVKFKDEMLCQELNGFTQKQKAQRQKLLSLSANEKMRMYITIWIREKEQPHCGGLTLAECQVLTKPLYLSLPSTENRAKALWGLLPVHHTLSLPLLAPHCFPLIQGGVPPMGESTPWTPPTWVFPQPTGLQ